MLGGGVVARIRFKDFRCPQPTNFDKMRAKGVDTAAFSVLGDVVGAGVEELLPSLKLHLLLLRPAGSCNLLLRGAHLSGDF